MESGSVSGAASARGGEGGVESEVGQSTAGDGEGWEGAEVAGVGMGGNIEDGWGGVSGEEREGGASATGGREMEGSEGEGEVSGDSRLGFEGGEGAQRLGADEGAGAGAQGLGADEGAGVEVELEVEVDAGASEVARETEGAGSGVADGAGSVVADGAGSSTAQGDSSSGHGVGTVHVASVAEEVSRLSLALADRDRVIAAREGQLERLAVEAAGLRAEVARLGEVNEEMARAAAEKRRNEVGVGVCVVGWGYVGCCRE